MTVFLRKEEIEKARSMGSAVAFLDSLKESLGRRDAAGMDEDEARGKFINPGGADGNRKENRHGQNRMA